MRTGQSIWISAMLALVLLFLSCLYCWAVPQQVNYQGRLTDADGIAVAVSTLTMDFAIYDSETGETPLWSETQSVSVNGGVFNVKLGQDPGTNPFPTDLFSNDTLYLGITVGSDDEMSSRQLLTSVPFALQAEDAEFAIMAEDSMALEGHGPEAFALVIHTHNFSDITDSISDGQIPAVITRDTELVAGLVAKADIIHTHDDRYYTKAYVDSLVIALEANTKALLGRINDLESLLANVSRTGDDLYFDSMNVHVRNGTGATDSNVNSLGNLIVGYNEERGLGDDRSGSHNLVVGIKQNFSCYGGLLAGFYNEVSSPYASVAGGYNNTASGNNASISGGIGNTASGNNASVSGGGGNTASGYAASVSGGDRNEAFGKYTAIAGGKSNLAGDPGKLDHNMGEHATISGGYNNTASGQYASVTGGGFNIASGSGASVAGGGGLETLCNEAYGDYTTITGGRMNVTGDPNKLDHLIGYNAVVSGGGLNTASGSGASITGGFKNTASGNFARVSGGYNNIASGYAASVAGGGGLATADGNEAFGNFSVIVGGRENLAGDPEKLDHELGEQATIGGGIYNIASGITASVAGGINNTASGQDAAIAGGADNVASGAYTCVSGGGANIAEGYKSSVSGGNGRKVSGNYDWQAGSLFQDY